MPGSGSPSPADQPMTDVKCVVWDMGGIFRRYFTQPMVEIGVERGWPLERLPLGPTGPFDDPHYRAMSEGLLDEPGYLRLVIESLASEGIEFDPTSDLDWLKEERAEVWEAIRLIAASPTSQVILTNDATRWMGERWWETWEHASLFDDIIDVATLHRRKPLPEPYLEVLARTGFAAGDCVFVDDMPVNCRGAEAVGMQSIWFDITDPNGAIDRLLSMLGLDKEAN